MSSGSASSNGCPDGHGSDSKKRSLEGTGGAGMPDHASYVVYCQGRKSFSNGLADDELHRTGRWNEEEVEFVDQLVTNFDQGLLPITDGTKLSSFLGDILLCKASRLTKKMKNAKLSSRSFVLSAGSQSIKAEDCRMLSALQEHFINSLPSDSAQLEMRFNIAKQWRTYFSNLCVEVEFPHLDVSDWIASLEELESRASEAESHMRNVRRRRMGLGRGTTNDVPTTTSVNSSFSAGSDAGTASAPMTRFVPRPISSQSLAASRDVPSFAGAAASQQNDLDDESEGSFDDLVSDSPNDLSYQSLAPKFATPAKLGDDFDSAMMFLMGQDSANMFQSTPRQTDFRDWSTSGNPFLEAIAVYLRERNFPFEYIDCWVPSLANNEASDEVRLLPAGFVARDDEDYSMSSALRAFGEYSKSFSFKPGSGLPGRVYMSGRSSWQLSLSDVHPSIFARVGGAKIYGLKTAAAIPLSAPGVGRMIVVMYSTRDLPEDLSLLDQCSMELSRYAPQPKWKLVIEIGDGEESKDLPASSEGLFGSLLDPTTARPEENANNTQKRGRSNSTVCGESTDDRNIETRIISLLGDQMPSFVSKSSTTGEPSSSTVAIDMEEYLPDIMRMRLLLLRPACKRSPEQNEAIEILISSFKNYAEESQRSNSEIAMLLAREWSCLKSCCPLSPAQDPTVVMPPVPALDDSASLSASAAAPDTYVSHVMDNPTANAGETASIRALLPPRYYDLQPTPLPHDGTMLVYDHSINKNSTNNNFLANTPLYGHTTPFFR